MTAFTSTAREDVNRNADPEPWLVTDRPFGEERWRQSDAQLDGRDNETFEATCHPRPEFDTVRPEDPAPWLHVHASENCRDTGDRMATNNGIGNIYDPRPDYRPEPNPILAALRGYADHSGDAVAEARAILNALDMKTLFQQVGTAQIDHARKVLTRLANVYKEV